MNILYAIIIYPITQIIEFVFVFAQKLFKETGLSIMCVSGAISVLCLPLYLVAEKWQEIEREVQKRFAPKIAKIKDAFKGDERYMVLSTYYRQNHYHPVYAMRSTFGLLIQIPFFIAAYSYLSHLAVLQGASFLFIPDLGKPDALIPIAGGINFLPILMTFINCFSGMIYSRGLAVKDKVQIYGISLLFLVLLYNSPSALVLYWTLNNVFSLFKNIYFKINISSTTKRNILYGLMSLVCFMLVFYIAVISQGVRWTRIVTASVLGIIAILPWLFILLKKPLEKIHNVFYSAKEELSLFLLYVSIMWLLTGFFIPSMLIAASPQEFSFIDSYTTPLFFIFNTALQSFGFCIFWTLILYFLFSKNIKRVFLITAFIVAYCALVNTFVFPGNYGLITINLTMDDVSHNIKEVGVNILVLIAVSCITVALFFTGKKRICIFLGTIPALALAVFSIINLSAINKEYQNLALYYNPKQTTVQEIKPLFHLSRTGKNVVVLMLDRGTGVLMPYIFEESPELYEKYSGFTFYPNTVSFAGYTRNGAPPLFGGYEYAPLEINKRDTVSIVEKYNEALLIMPRIFLEAGYAVTATDPPYAGGNWIADLRIYKEYPGISAHITMGAYTDLWLKEHDFYLPSTSDGLKRNILWYALFRQIPLAFRHSIYNTGEWCSPITGHDVRSTIDNYSVLDYLPKLTGISSQKVNTLFIMDNETPHRGTFMQAPDYTPVLIPRNFGTSPFSKEMKYHTNAAAIKRLADWFDYLKKEEVYDNTRIILVADHGPAQDFTAKKGLPFSINEYNPLLMVKDFNASGIMKTDMAFMSNADAPSLAMEGLIENPHNPFTGKKITMETKERPLYIARGKMGTVSNKSETQLDLDPRRDYYVHSNIFDEQNWIRAKDFEQ
jgi:YidC/Oxa1 family membrane protein insertase